MALSNTVGQLPWRERGVWLAGDTHAHYRNVGVARLAAEASRFCDFISITSHSHRPEFLAAQHGEVVAARRIFPNLLIFHGVEWACPVGCHATVLIERSRSEDRVLKEFLRRYDRFAGGSEEHSVAQALRGMRFLRRQARETESIVILNHPSYGSSAAPADLRALAAAGGACIGLEGARGNQSRQPGSEIEPMVRRVGGLYDALLAEGCRWSVVAASDFHAHVAEGGRTFWPGEFARTFVYCPDRSYAGVLAGLRAGAVYFVHGDIIGPLQFTACTDRGMAMMGETIRVPRGTSVEFVLDCVEHATLDRVEFISNHRSRDVFTVARRSRRRRVGPWSRFRFPVSEAQRDFYVRVRGCARQVRKPHFGTVGTVWFYTSAIRVEVV